MKSWNRIYKKLRIYIVFVFALLLPVVIKNNYYLHVANLCLIFALLTLSLNLLSGCTGLFSTGHIAFYGIGAYTSAILTVRLNMPILLGFIAAGCMACLMSLLLGLPTMQLRGMYLSVATLAFGEIVYRAIVNLVKVTNGTKGIKNIPAPNLFGLSIDTYGKYYYLILFILIAAIFISGNLIRSKPGRAMLSIRGNEIAAEAMGVNIRAYKTLAFMVSAFLAGIAGALYAHEVHYISPETFASAESMAVLAMMVVGGIGSIPGSIVGGIALTALPELLRSFGSVRLVIYGAAIVAIMLFAPKGLGGAIEWMDAVLCGKAQLKAKRRRKDVRNEGVGL